MELLQLKYFCDTAETQNFSHTAKKYFVPASSVSQSIKRLEQELGAELFEHMGNKIFLADAGKRFYEKAKSALLLLEEGRQTVAESDLEVKGEISLAVICNRGLVSQAIEAFRQDYPDVNFLLKHELGEGETCDIVISDQVPIGYTEEKLLVEESILLAVRQDHPLSQKAQISIKELFGEKFISMPKGNSLNRITEEICGRAGFLPTIAIQTPDPYYIRKYVELGLGIAFVPSYSWRGLFTNNVALKKAGSCKRKTYVCLPNGSRRKPAVSVYLQYLDREKAKSMI